jgi:hypothetical protein
MHVQYCPSARLPRLAWCAAIDQARECAVVRHGRSVEIGDDFFIEGAWNGDFAAGDFASSECVFGSGAVVSGRGITFVASCSTTDPLFYATSPDCVVVSNSLAFLLAANGDELDFSYPGYFENCESVINGINDYHKAVPTLNGSVRRLLFRNLAVSRDSVQEIDKQPAPAFATYADYHTYLDVNYGRIAANVRSTQRTEPVDILSTQSRGYDSTAVNALASRYGIDRVFTSPNSKSVDAFGEERNAGFQNDDGSDICRTLGLACVPIDRRYYEKSGFPDEYLYYASQPGNQDANLLEINSHISRVSVLLTGVLGELWYDAAFYASRPGLITPELRKLDVGGHGMTEVRLRSGFVQLALPYMGAQRRDDIYRITNSREMDAWRVNPPYDRPIPRRIAEERGVPRQLFGQVKMGSVMLFPSPRLPRNQQLRREFLGALVDHGVVSRWQTRAWSNVHVINTILDRRSPDRFRAVYYLERAISRLRVRPFEFGQLWSYLNGSLFCYCVNKCAREYAEWMRADSVHDAARAVEPVSAPAAC